MPLLYLSILSPLVPLIGGINKRTSLLWLYPLIALFSDITVFVLKRVLHVGHSWPGNVFILIEFILITLVYRDRIFFSTKIFWLTLLGLSGVYLVVGWSHFLDRFNIVGTTIFSFAYIVYGILGFFYLLRRQEVLFLEKSWFFWFNTALTIYASGNFLLLLFMDYMLRLDRVMYLKIWYSVFQALNITKNLLIAVALYHYKPVARESH